MQNSCVEECKGRAAFAFCSTLTGMQLQSKRYARPAIHRSTKRPFPHFTSGVRNQGGSGVWSSQLRLNNSAADENDAEIPKSKKTAWPLLVPKMTDAGENHCHLAFVGSGDNLFVAH